MDEEAMTKTNPFEVAAGEKTRFWFRIARQPDGSWLQLPVMVVVGTEPGPTLLATGLVHGDEYEGAQAIRSIWSRLEPTTFRGRFIGIPVVNAAAFSTGRRVGWADGINMNRVFPGDRRGLPTPRVAGVLFDEFARRADYVVSCPVQVGDQTVLVGRIVERGE